VTLKSVTDISIAAILVFILRSWRFSAFGAEHRLSRRNVKGLM
jgi:hypothetical protein